MQPRLPTDEDTNFLFDSAVSLLRGEFGYSQEDANRLAGQYYTLFSDPDYCHSIGIPVQNDDFYHHEASGGLALLIHYYLGLRADPDPHKFIEWRAEYYRQRR